MHRWVIRANIQAEMTEPAPGPPAPPGPSLGPLGGRALRGTAIISVAVVGLTVATVVYAHPRLPRIGPGARAAPLQVCDVSFDDAVHGSVVLCSRDGPREAVYVTFDAGRSWRQVPVSPVIDGHVAWFNGGRAVLEGYRDTGVGVWVTDDGGRSWLARSTAPAPTLPYTESLPQFLDPSHAIHFWYLDQSAPPPNRGPHPVELWRTDDGARSWRHVAAAGIPREGFKQLLLFTSPDDGFLALSTPESPSWPRLLVTTDGAQSWQPVAMALPPNMPYRVFGWGMLQTGTRLVLWVQDVEGGTRTHLYTSVSEDGGGSWTEFAAGPTASRDRPQVDDRGWLVLQDDDRLWWSSDGGRSWTVGLMQIPKGVRSLQIRSTASGALFAVGEQEPGVPAGVVLRSQDHGDHWERLPLPKVKTLPV